MDYSNLTLTHSSILCSFSALQNYSTIGISRTSIDEGTIGQASTPSSEELALKKYLSKSVNLGTASICEFLARNLAQFLN